MSEKPNWMSDRDWFVKKLSQTSHIDEEIVSKVIRHQFESVVQATQKVKRVEISGIGTLIWNDGSAQKKLDRMNAQIGAFREKIAANPDGADAQRWSDIIDSMLVKRQMLINRINVLETKLRRLEKQPGAKKGAKESNKQDS